MLSLKNILTFLTLLGMLALAFFIGRHSGSAELATANRDVSQVNTPYKFISPLLECGDYQASNLMNSDASDIENNLASYIATRKSAHQADDVSLYFRDLNNGPYVNINASKSFIPGSLLKVPVAISVYKQAENKPSILQQKAVFKKSSADLDSSQYFKPQEKIEPGQTYSLEDLMRYMLVDSDNNAAILAVSFLDSEDLMASYDNLGLRPPVAGNGQYTVTVKDYASFFRILYNASYLDGSASEHILSLLSQATFKGGLVAGVPQGVVVSHKFGERTTDTGRVQLHDCGIVYKPNQPYMLCVMTQGPDFDTLAATIADISHIVYKTLETDN